MMLENTVLYFRRATIASNMQIQSDMLKVRILPDMAGLSSDELPIYSMFNPSTLVKGVSEEDANGDINKASQVWVVCTEDFKIGWVFGDANKEYSIEDEKVDNPYAFKTLYQHLNRQRQNTNSFKYAELRVLYTNSNYAKEYETAGLSSRGGRNISRSFDIVNVRTGERWWMLESGTAFSFMQDGITLRVGSPDKKSSFISITASKIEIVADHISIWGKTSTSLGKHGYQVVGMLGAPTAVDGSPLIPMLDMTC